MVSPGRAFYPHEGLAVSQADYYNDWETAHTPLSGDKMGNVREEAFRGSDPEWFRDWVFAPPGKKLMRVCLDL